MAFPGFLCPSYLAEELCTYCEVGNARNNASGKVNIDCHPNMEFPKEYHKKPIRVTPLPSRGPGVYPVTVHPDRV